MPKLVLSPFDGNTLNETSFWDQSEFSINSKKGIGGTNKKSSYVKSFIAQGTLGNISGLTFLLRINLRQFELAIRQVFYANFSGFESSIVFNIYMVKF